MISCLNKLCFNFVEESFVCMYDRVSDSIDPGLLMAVQQVAKV